MATTVKNARTLQASATNAAAGTTTGSGLSLTTAFGGVVTLVVTNGVTGPTLACDAITEVSRDGTNWHEFSRQATGVVADATYVRHVPIPPEVMHLRAKFQGNTGQRVTVEAYFMELTSIG